VSRIRENHEGKESQENLQIQYRLEMFDSGLNVEKENSGFILNNVFKTEFVR
jgi:hypothetical protein